MIAGEPQVRATAIRNIVSSPSTASHSDSKNVRSYDSVALKTHYSAPLTLPISGI